MKCIFRKCQLVAFTGLVLINVACDNSNKYSFKSTKEAVDVCRQELADLKGKEKVGVKELSRIIADWSVLQDSAIATMCNDTSTQAVEMLNNFDGVFPVADSIRDEIMRLAFSQPRTLKDVVYIKSHICQRDEKQDTKIFETAEEFFESLDKNTKLYRSKDETLRAYHQLLTNTPPFKKEGELLNFIRKEDCCFQSLLSFLHEMQPDELRNITVQTSDLFEEVSKVSNYDGVDEQSQRVQTYLQMRLNRRMIQNALTCMNDVKNRVKLTDIQSANYRWMMIQPFFVIDNDGMACLTDDQLDALEDLAEELPKVLLKLDKTINKTNVSNEENNKLADVLSHYLLKTCISMNI